MPDELINVVINYGQARSETAQIMSAIDALSRTIDRLSAVAEAMGTKLASGLVKAQQSISVTTNAVTGLSTTVTSASQKTADGIRLISRETDSMAQRMRVAQRDSENLVASLERIAGMRFSQAQNISSRRLQELGLGATPSTTIGESYMGVSGALYRRQLEANLASQSQAQLAEAEFNRRMQAEIATRRSVRPEVMGDLQRRAGFQGGELLTSSIRLEPVLDKQGRVVGQNAQAFIRMADGQTRAISTNDTFQQSVTRGSGALEGFGRRVAGIASGILVWEAFRTVTNVIQEVVQAQALYSIETARFAAITEQSIGQAIRSYDQLQDTFSQVGFGPAAAAPALTLIGQFTRVSEEQRRIADTSADLALLLGIEPARATDILITALRQAGLEAAEVGRIGNLVADTLRRGPAVGQELAQALEESIPLANQWGISLEQAFQIVIQGATAAADSPNKIANALQSVTDGLLDLEKGGEAAFDRTRKLFDLGIDVKIGGQLREIPDILQQVGQALSDPNIDPARAQQILEALTGGSIRPERMRSLLVALREFADGIPQIGSDTAGALDEMTEGISKSFGVQLNALDAEIEQLRQRGDILQNVWVSILRGTVAQFGGIQGVEFTRQQAQQAPPFTFGLGGTASAVLDSGTQGKMSGEEFGKAFVGGFIGAITEDRGFFQAFAENLRNITSREGLQELGVQFPEEERPTGEPPGLKELFRERITGEEPLFGTALDATKYTMQEIADARALAVQMADAELQAQVEFLRALGLSNIDIQEYIDHQREVLDLTTQVVRTQEGVRIYRGPEAQFLQESLRQQQAGQGTSDFAFRRLKDVDPSQFGQLQALTQMYNAMLTRLGSPEEEKNINLLLGEQNVFKQLTGRMSALQLALEDLTKVEKAQLSGTWNLPSGATALVPISSLDIQRWNGQGGGGGMTPEALMAFLQQFAGMLGGGAGGGAGAPAEAPRRRGAPSGLLPSPEEMRQGEEERREEQLRRRRARGFGQPAPTAPDTGRDTGSMSDELRSRAGRAEAARIETIVNVAMLPIKATIAVNIPVLLNGQVIARIVQQLFYQWFTRQTRSSPTRANNTVGGVRG